MEINMESGEKLAENKLIILYLLSKTTTALSNLQILKLLYDFEGFNYYYFQHLLSDLVEKNYIAYYKQEEEWLYLITEKGKEILNLTSDMLPGIIKHKLDIVTNELLSKVQNEAAVTSEFLLEPNGDYTTRCRISETHKTLFEINVYCGTQEQAKTIADNWKKNASNLYPEMIRLLTQESKV